MRAVCVPVPRTNSHQWVRWVCLPTVVLDLAGASRRSGTAHSVVPHSEQGMSQFNESAVRRDRSGKFAEKPPAAEASGVGLADADGYARVEVDEDRGLTTWYDAAGNPRKQVDEKAGSEIYLDEHRKLDRDPTEGPAESQGRERFHYAVHGVTHREDGPAVLSNGRLEWHDQGLLHRTDGPAIRSSNGISEHYVDGEKVERSKPSWAKERDYGTSYAKTPEDMRARVGERLEYEARRVDEGDDLDEQDTAFCKAVDDVTQSDDVQHALREGLTKRELNVVEGRVLKKALDASSRPAGSDRDGSVDGYAFAASHIAGSDRQEPLDYRARVRIALALGEAKDVNGLRKIANTHGWESDYATRQKMFDAGLDENDYL